MEVATRKHDLCMEHERADVINRACKALLAIDATLAQDLMAIWNARSREAWAAIGECERYYEKLQNIKKMLED